MKTLLTLIIALSFFLVGYSLGRIDCDVVARSNADKITRLQALYR